VAFQYNVPLEEYKPGFVPSADLTVGTKESLFPGARYYVFEYVAAGEGKVKRKKRGVLYATNKVADNRTDATGKSLRSHFIQTAGRRLDQGMLVKEQPRLGVDLSLGYVNNVDHFYGLNISYPIFKPFYKLMSPKSYGKVPLQFLSLYLQGGLAIHKYDDLEKDYVGIQSNLWTLQNNDFPLKKEGKDGVMSISMAGGLEYTFYILKLFQFIPYAGYKAELSSFINDDASTRLKDNADENKYGFVQGFEAGARLGFNIVNNVRIVGSIGYSHIKYDSEKHSFGEETDFFNVTNVDNPYYLKRSPLVYGGMLKIVF